MKCTALIASGIKSGAFIDDDPRMLGRLVLPLIISVWRWYRPEGKLTLDDINVTVTNAALRIVRP